MSDNEVHKIVRVDDAVTWTDQIREVQVQGRVVEVLYGRAKCLEYGRPLFSEQTVDLADLRVDSPRMRAGDTVADWTADGSVPPNAVQGRVLDSRSLGRWLVQWEDGRREVLLPYLLLRVPIPEQHPGARAA